LAAIGHRITLFCAEPTSALGSIDPSMTEWKLRPGITIHPVKSYSRNPMLRACFTVLPWLKWLPDEFSSWILPVYAAAKRHLRQAGGKPVLCTFSNPWSDHIAGSWLKARFKLPWVAHFSDPWAENPYPQWRRATRMMERRMEKAVVRAADRAIFVSEETRDLFVRSNGEFLAPKSDVIPHIMAPEWLGLGPRVGKNTKLTLTHTGDLYGLRTPAGLVQALCELKCEAPAIVDLIQVRLIGSMEPNLERLVLAANLSEIISLVKPVTIAESFRQMKAADILLVIEGKTEGESMFLPSKLIEYIGSGNPLFGLTPLRGTSAKLISSLHGLVADPLDVPAIKACLVALVEQHAAVTLRAAHRYDQERIRQFTQASAAERFSDIVQGVPASPEAFAVPFP
jgi:hypothetical protein